MGFDFFESTHFKIWIISRYTYGELVKKDVENLGWHDYRVFFIIINGIIKRIAKYLDYPSRVIHTAFVYVRRYFTVNSFRSTDIFLVAVTALCLSCKTNEVVCPGTFRINYFFRKLLAEIGDPDTKSTFRSVDILHCEATMIEALRSSLHVFSPLEPLADYIRFASLFFNFDQNLLASIITYTDGFINDSFNTEICLLKSPHIIAASAMFAAFNNYQIYFQRFFELISVPMDEILFVIDSVFSSLDIRSEALSLRQKRSTLRSIAQLYPECNQRLRTLDFCK